MSHLRHRELTYELRGLIFEVRKKLKTGWSEEVYHQALFQLAQDRDIPVISKPRKTVFHRGVEVALFECDLIVWDLIILELKALPYTKFADAHYAQLVHYLKCWDKDLGLLVNFGPTRAQIERFVWDEPDLDIREDYDWIKADMNEEDRVCLRKVRAIILNIAQQYGLGYPEIMYRTLTSVEMDYRGLNCQTDLGISAKWDGRILAQHLTDHMLVEGQYLINICSLLKHPSSYEFARTKTYLNSLGLKLGLIVNFGKKQLQIFGVNAE